MVDTITLYLDNTFDSPIVNKTYIETYNEIMYGNCDFVYTTIPNFLSFEYAEHLFVEFDDESHEIKLGDCEGTDKEIRKEHNIMKMLLAGHFDWFKVK